MAPVPGPPVPPVPPVPQQLRRRVIVLLKHGVDLVEQGVHRSGLGFGGGRRAAVGLGRRIGRGAVVVAAPVGGEVAVEVHAVARRDHAVGVVVAQVLAPEAVARRERVLVAVGVVDADEPQLGAVDEARHLEAGTRALAVVVDEVVQRAPARLAGQPLAGVLHRVVEHGGTPGDVRPRGALGDLQGEDLASAVGRPGDALRGDRGEVGEDARVSLGVLLLAAATASYFVHTSKAASVAPAVGSASVVTSSARLALSFSASSFAPPICSAVPTTSIVPRSRLRPSVTSKPGADRARRFFAVASTRYPLSAGAACAAAGASAVMTRTAPTTNARRYTAPPLICRNPFPGAAGQCAFATIVALMSRTVSAGAPDDVARGPNRCEHGGAGPTGGPAPGALSG